jgi:hypothetical protein
VSIVLPSDLHPAKLVLDSTLIQHENFNDRILGSCVSGYSNTRQYQGKQESTEGYERSCGQWCLCYVAESMPSGLIVNEFAAANGTKVPFNYFSTL